MKMDRAMRNITKFYFKKCDMDVLLIKQLIIFNYFQIN